MRGAVLQGPGDIRVEERDDPKIVEPTDAIIRLSATCICGSDLWPYRGEAGDEPAPMGHEAVGLHPVLAPHRLGAERIIVMSRHESRQKLALDYGATDIVQERGDEGAARIKDLTDGLRAHSTIEAVGTRESMLQAIASTRPGGHIGYVGVTHGDLPGQTLFFSHTHLHGGPAPVRRCLPEHIELICNREIEPGN